IRVLRMEVMANAVARAVGARVRANALRIDTRLELRAGEGGSTSTAIGAVAGRVDTRAVAVDRVGRALALARDAHRPAVAREPAASAVQIVRLDVEARGTALR